jgi:hypothetical protein
VRPEFGGCRHRRREIPLAIEGEVLGIVELPGSLPLADAEEKLPSRSKTRCSDPLAGDVKAPIGRDGDEVRHVEEALSEPELQLGRP